MANTGSDTRTLITRAEALAFLRTNSRVSERSIRCAADPRRLLTRAEALTVLNSRHQ
jgi:hypothetical protein